MAPVDDDDGHVPPRLSALGPGSAGTCRPNARGAATSDVGVEAAGGMLEMPGLPPPRCDDDDGDDDGEEGSRTAWARTKAFYWRNLGLLLFFLGQTFGSTVSTERAIDFDFDFGWPGMRCIDISLRVRVCVARPALGNAIIIIQ